MGQASDHVTSVRASYSGPMIQKPLTSPNWSWSCFKRFKKAAENLLITMELLCISLLYSLLYKLEHNFFFMFFRTYISWHLFRKMSSCLSHSSSILSFDHFLTVSLDILTGVRIICDLIKGIIVRPGKDQRGGRHNLKIIFLFSMIYFSLSANNVEPTELSPA